MAYAKKRIIRTDNGRAKAIYSAMDGNTVYESLGDTRLVYQALGGAPPPMKAAARSKVYQALGGASDCGPDQDWDAGCNYAGVQGQCVPKGMAGKQPGCDYSSTSTASQIANVAGSLLSTIFGSKPSAPSATMPVQTGMSTGTKIALASAAVLGLVLVARR